MNGVIRPFSFKLECGLQPGGQVTVRLDYMLFTEEQFSALVKDFNAYMKPIWAKREEEQRMKEAANMAERFRNAQKVVDVGGFKFRVQGRLDTLQPVAAWPEGENRQTASVLVEPYYARGGGRRFSIRKNLTPPPECYRPLVKNKSGATRTFESVDKALAYVVAKGLIGKPECP